MGRSRKKNEQSLGDVLKDLLEKPSWKNKINEVRVMTEWDKLFGSSFSQYIEDIFVQNQILYVKLNSASLRQELNYQKTTLINRLNESIGKNFIKDIILK